MEQPRSCTSQHQVFSRLNNKHGDQRPTVEAPLGFAGKAIDKTLLRGTAEESLRVLLEIISKDATAAIGSRELASIRNAEFTR